MTETRDMSNSVVSVESIDRDDLSGLTVGITVYDEHRLDDSRHSHANPTFCFLLSGSGIERRSKDFYGRGPCDLRFYWADEPHQSCIKHFPAKCLNLDLDRKMLRKYDISENALENVVDTKRDAKFLMLKIHYELLANDIYSASAIKMHFMEMVSSDNLHHRGKPDWVNKAGDILQDKWNQHITLDEMSSELGLHPVTISKGFRQHFHCSFGEFRRKIKIDRSLELIKTSGLSLTDIAFLSGFSDQSHFVRNFRKMVGFRPKDFKRL